MSALFRPGRVWNARMSGGTGVFAPTPLTEETEVIGLSRLRPFAGLSVERATGVPLDVGGKLGRLGVDVSAGNKWLSPITDPQSPRRSSGTRAPGRH